MLGSFLLKRLFNSISFFIKIRGYLRDFGNIESITLLCDKDKKSRGVAYVEFSTTDESADFIRRHIRGKQSLIHMDGYILFIRKKKKKKKNLFSHYNVK